MIAIFDNTSGEILFIVEDTSNYDLTGRGTATVPDDYPDAWRWDVATRTFIQDFSVMHAWMLEGIEKAIADDLIAYQATFPYSQEEMAELADYEANGLVISTVEYRFPNLHNRWITTGSSWDDVIKSARDARDTYEGTKFFAIRQNGYAEYTLLNYSTAAEKRWYYDFYLSLPSRLSIHPNISIPDRSLRDAPLTRMWLPRTTTTTPTLVGMGNTVAGTVTNPGVDNNAFVTSMPRLRYTATSAIPRCSWTHGTREVSVGHLDKYSGFQFGIRWRFVNWENGARFFAGLVPQQTAVATSATSFTEVCGALFENYAGAENVLSLFVDMDPYAPVANSVYKRNFSTLETPVNNVSPATDDVFDLRITKPPGSSRASLSLKGAGVITIDQTFIGDNLFCPQFYIDKGTATNDVAIEVYKMWLTTY